MASDSQRKLQIKQFIKDREGKGYEKGQAQSFWIDLLGKVLGVENPTQFIEFEDLVKIDKTNGFIDGFIPSTKVLIEQKGIDKNLRDAIKQSDGSLLNPFQQAKRYSAELSYERRPRWIITCNFKSFLVYDMNNPNSEPEEILLENLEKEYYRLNFIVNEKAEHIKKEEEISFKAGDLIGRIYDAFAEQYEDLEKKSSQESLNELCVRLVFCLYAEDAGIFGKKDMFHDFLIKYENDLDAMRKALIELFKILDTKEEDRDKYLSDDLAQFPYVNGGLFSNENIEIPKFTKEIKDLILIEASVQFDWSEISPTIFGAIFESTLNPETRRKGGMHYTSIENIHKVIDPLFLNDLREELDKYLAYKRDGDRRPALVDFQKKLAGLRFFDPACGSGNFLTETYLSLRRLENEAIRAFGGATLNPEWIVNVHIDQFYGIEINDFAVKVATTALWIAESQTIRETEKIVGMNINFLPLKSYTNIKKGNALRMDRNEVIPSNECNYIMGNPPFIGGMLMTKEQKADMINVFGNVKGIGEADYVAARYRKSAEMMSGTDIKAALVSTNSITQGEQPAIIFKHLFEEYKIQFNFAYKTFQRDSEANMKAHVHCVIIGFSNTNNGNKLLFDSNGPQKAKNINAYLVDAPTIFIENRGNPICNVPHMSFGNMPRDGGFFTVSEEEKDLFIKENPKNGDYIKPYIGAEEFINNKKRYCLRLQNAKPEDIKNSKLILERVDNVRNFRLQSKAKSTQKFADTPTIFCQITQPVGAPYLLVPRVSSEKRRYVPIGFLDGNTIASDATQIIPNASVYHFGVLTSNVHMARMRAVAGRLEMRYRYSKDIVYNNFPRPNPTADQKQKIQKTAMAILDARKLYIDSSLAALYDERTMPVELRKAHQDNDRAVMEAYGFNTNMTESECVAKLMEMYKELVNKK